MNQEVGAHRRSQAGNGSSRLSSESILDTAAAAFAQGGYRGTNLDDVAAKLGVTRQAIYYYFPKKQDLLHALYLQHLTALTETASLIVKEAEDPGERFNLMLRAHIRVVASNPELSAIFAQERGQLTPQQARTVRDLRRRYTNRLLEAYDEAVRNGTFRSDVPSELAVSLLLGAANWVYVWYRPQRAGTPESFADTALSFLLHGWLNSQD